MPEYAVGAVLSVLAVVALELGFLKTGLLATRAYWLSMAICLGFMILVDGWLTKLSAPIVTYDPTEFSGWRFPWDIPVEDYLFGFTLLTLAMLLWDLAGAHRSEQPSGLEGAASGDRAHARVATQSERDQKVDRS